MKKWIVVSMCVFAAGAIARPEPEMGESVDAYLDRWDEWVATIPHDERAHPLIETIDAQLTAALDATDGERFWAGMPPGPEGNYGDRADWEWTVEFIESHPEVLETIRTYAALSAVGSSLRDASFEYRFRDRATYVVELGPKPLTLADIAPRYLGSMRLHSLLLKADMYRAIEAGNDQRLLRDVRAIYGIARMSRITGAWIHQLMTTSFGNLVVSPCINPDVDWSGIDTETMRTMLETMDQIFGLATAADTLEAERIVSHESLEWLAADSSGDWFGPLGVARRIDLSNGLLPPAPAWLVSSDTDRLKAALFATMFQYSLAPISDQTAKIDAYFDAAVALSGQDLSRLRVYPDAIEFFEGEGRAPALRYSMAEYVMNASGLRFNFVAYPTGLAATRLRIGMEIHKRRHGSFPHKAEDLDPDLLEFDMTDRFSGEPLRIMITDGEPTVYSVGTNRVDDRGDAWVSSLRTVPEFLTLDELNALSDEERAEIDGDWVLYPPSN